MNMRGTKEGDINQYLADTISSVFDEVYTVDVEHSSNRELFASNSNEMLSRFANNGKQENDEELLAMMNIVKDNLIAYKAGNYVMTDDKAPVELLGMRVIDELIRDEVSYYKRIYEEEGIEGILRVIA